MREQGYPFDTNSWYGLFAPAGTPAPIVKRLNAEINGMLGDPQIRERFALMNMANPPAKTSEAFAATIREDIKVWGEIIRANGVTVD